MTHPDITDKTLRSMYAKELFVIRRVCWNMNTSPKKSDFFWGNVVGIDTIFRRMQFFLCTDVTLKQYMDIAIVKRNSIPQQ